MTVPTLDLAMREVVRAVVREELADRSAPDPWVPIVEVDALIGKAERKRGEKSGELPTRRRGRRVFVRRSALDRFLEGGHRPRAAGVKESDHVADILVRNGWRSSDAAE